MNIFQVYFYVASPNQYFCTVSMNIREFQAAQHYVRDEFNCLDIYWFYDKLYLWPFSVTCMQNFPPAS